MMDIETARYLLNEMWGRAIEAKASKSSRSRGLRAARVDDGWMRFEHALPNSAAREAKSVLPKYNLNKEQQRWILQLLFRIEADPRLDWRQKIRHIERYLVVPMTSECIRERTNTNGKNNDPLTLHDLATPSRGGLCTHENGIRSMARDTDQNAGVASGLDTPGDPGDSPTISSNLTNPATEYRDYEFIDIPQHCSPQSGIGALQPDRTGVAAGNTKETSHCNTLLPNCPLAPTSQQFHSTRSSAELPCKDSEINIDCKLGTDLVSQHQQYHASCLESGGNRLLEIDIIDATRTLAFLRLAALKLTAGQLMRWYNALIGAKTSVALVSSALPIFETVLASRLLHAWRKIAMRAAFLNKYAKRAAAMRTISILWEFARRRSCLHRLQIESAALYHRGMLQYALSNLKFCVICRRSLRIATSEADIKLCRRGINFWHEKTLYRRRLRESITRAETFRVARNFQILKVHAKGRRRIRSVIARTQARFRSRAATRTFEMTRHLVQLVQHRWRILHERQKLLSLGFARAATCVQARTRSRIYRKAFQRLRLCVIQIQSHTRTLLQRLVFSRKKSAALLLQTAARAFVAFFMLRRMQAASLLLQSLLRRKFAVRLLQTLRKSACFIQRSWRRLDMRKHDLARRAVLIQSMWRGSSRRRAYFQMRSACAMVQKSLRKATCRKFFVKKIRVIRQRQACARAVVLRKRFKKSLRLIVKVQACFRRSIACSWYASHTRGATALQSLVRSTAARSHFVSFRRVTVTVQKWVRKVQAKMQLAKHRDSILRLQRFCRDYYTKIALQRCGITVQRMSRRLLMSWRFSWIFLNVIRIQSFFRLLRARTRYLCITRSAALIQIHTRKARARNMSKSRRLAVQAIQKKGRIFIARRIVRNRLNSIVRLQTYLRSWKHRRLYLDSIVSLYKVQYCVMQFTAKRRRSIRIVAVRRLQRFFVNTLQYFRRSNAIALEAWKYRVEAKVLQTLRGYAQTVRSKCMQRTLLSCFLFLLKNLRRKKRARQDIVQMNQQRMQRYLLDWSARASAKIRDKVACTKSANFYAFRRLRRGIAALHSLFVKRRDDQYSRTAALEYYIVKTSGVALSNWHLVVERRRVGQMRMLIGARHRKHIALMRWSNQVVRILERRKRDQTGLRSHFLTVSRASIARLREYALDRRNASQVHAARMRKMADFKIRTALRNRFFSLVERRCACRYRMVHAAYRAAESKLRNHLAHWRRLILERKVVQQRMLTVRIAMVKLRTRQAVNCWLAEVVEGRAELTAIVRTRAMRHWRDYAKTHIIKRLKELQLVRQCLTFWYEVAMDMSVALSYYRDNLMQRVFSRWRLWSFGSRRILSNILQRTWQPSAVGGERLQRSDDRDDILRDVWMAQWQPTRYA